MVFAIVLIDNEDGLDIVYFENKMERNKYWNMCKMDNYYHVAKIIFDGDRKLQFEKCGNGCLKHCVCQPFRNKPIHRIIHHHF
jgi:hypothetical protein